MSMNLREVVGGSSVLALVARPPLGGLRPQTCWGSRPTQVCVVVFCLLARVGCFFF
jgi:hypothetical protein